MSAKNVDRHNRFRSITVGFRVSPEEQEELNRAVALSGLPKQEYCYRKCMGREVVVQPNPRVYKALKTQMTFILEELQRISAGENVQTELLDTIDLIAFTMHGLKGEKCHSGLHTLKKLCNCGSPKIHLRKGVRKWRNKTSVSPVSKPVQERRLASLSDTLSVKMTAMKI